MNAASGKCRLERRRETVGALHPTALYVVGLGIGDEIRISEGHAEIGKSVRCLLPADHPVSIVLQDKHDEIEPEARRRLHFLRILHEPAPPPPPPHPPAPRHHPTP